MKKIDTIVIAAGGQGMRLAEYFKLINFNNTKTLFPIKEGKSTLEFIIDSAIQDGYKKIFVLAGFYNKEIKYFINKFYKNSNIEIVLGNERGKKIGVTKSLAFIANRLTKPFVYTDGDIVFEPKLLNKLSNLKLVSKCLVSCVVSPLDAAKTHSQFLIKNKAVKDINVRCGDSQNRLKNVFCSLGLMVINNKVFKTFPEYEDMGDLDLVIEKLFNISHENIGYCLYKGEWLSIHTKDDIDKIKKGYYDSLKIFNNKNWF